MCAKPQSSNITAIISYSIVFLIIQLIEYFTNVSYYFFRTKWMQKNLLNKMNDTKIEMQNVHFILT